MDPTGHRRDETCAGLYSGSTSKKRIVPRGGHRDEESGARIPSNIPPSQTSGGTSAGGTPVIGLTNSVITTADTVEPKVYPQGPSGILGDFKIRNTQSEVTTMGTEGFINFGSYSRNETTVGLTTKVAGLKADVSASWEEVSAKAGISVGSNSYTLGATINHDILGVSSISFSTSNNINVNEQVSTVNATTYTYEAPTLLVVAVTVLAAPVVAVIGVGTAIVEGVGSFFGWVFGIA